MVGLRALQGVLYIADSCRQAHLLYTQEKLPFAHPRWRDKVKLLVYPYGTDVVTLIAHLATLRLNDRDMVVLLTPLGEERDANAQAAAESFELLVNMMRERGLDLVFKEVQLHISDFLKAVSEIVAALKGLQPDEITIDLSESVPILSVETYAAATVYASLSDSRNRDRIRIHCKAPKSASKVEVFVPIFSVSKFLPLLRVLDRRPGAKLSELQQILQRHPSTLSRQIKRAEKAGLIRKSEGEYRKTEFGKVILAVFTDQGTD